MKRFFILASAAIVALASCAKTEVVYKDAPQQIAFRQITNVMTKASLDTDVSLGVLADVTGGQAHFGNTQFTYVTDSWTAAVYWPYEGNLDFTVYAPYSENTVFADGILAIKNVQAGEQTYYGEKRYLNTVKDETVAVALNHSSAKISVNIKGSDLYTVTGLTLKNVSTSGTVNVVYDSSTGNATSVTTSDNTPASVDLKKNAATFSEVLNTTTPVVLDDVYLLPGAQTAFDITFTQGGLSFTKEISLSADNAKWTANSQYVYNITISAPDQIKLSATVNEWATPAVTADPTVN